MSCYVHPSIGTPESVTDIINPLPSRNSSANRCSIRGVRHWRWGQVDCSGGFIAKLHDGVALWKVPLQKTGPSGDAGHPALYCVGGNQSSPTQRGTMGGTTTAVRPTAMRAAHGASSGTTRAQRWLDRQFVRFAVLPTSVMMLLIFGVPLVFSLYLSFEGWSPEQALFAGNFAGTANYEDLLTDPQFLQSLWVTCIYTAITVSTELACGLGIALLLNIDLPWIGFFRTALVVPMMITPIVAALCWKVLLVPDHGVINYWIGSHIVWLRRPDTPLISVMGVNLWQNV